MPLPVVDRDVFDRYAGKSLPRHVSYPMPSWWKTLPCQDQRHGQTDAAAIRQRGVRDGGPGLSLYMHLPFCEALCKFCACNRTILRKTSDGATDKLDRYMDALHKEITLRGAEFGAAAPVRQVHWGGGTPTYLDCDRIQRLHQTTTEAFNIAPDAEVSIEIDPRVTTKKQLETLRRIGFNRVSLGVQDFDVHVQEHVRRVQPVAMVKATVDACREAGFESINFDLIYGMPYQTIETVADTVKHAVALAPDRVAFYHYAQIPDKVANQRGIHHHAMPGSNDKLTMFLDATERFKHAGYDFIGLDHFAKPDEMLSEAAKNGTLNRSFQGMTTGAPLDLIGMGASAIGCFPGRAYVQNQHDPTAYAETIENGAEPGSRGLVLTEDDAIRQAVVLDLYCAAAIDPATVLARNGVAVTDYFAQELDALEELQRDGLITLGPDGRVDLTYPLGRVLMRNVAAVFDAYLADDAHKRGHPESFSTSA